MNIEYSKPADKFLKKQDSILQNRLKKAIKALPSGNVIRIQGKDYVLYRLRVGDYRITFTREVKTDKDGNITETIFVEDIDSRGGIYKKL